MHKKSRKMRWFLTITVLVLVAAHFQNTLVAADEQDKDPRTVPIEMQKEWERNNPGALPIWLTPDEMNRLDEIGKDFRASAPPPGDIRQPAEFEPLEGVLIRYPKGISYAIIAEMSEDTGVTTIVSSTSQKNQVLGYYQSNGVNTSNCTFLIASSDTYWTRDYGPWFIFNGNDEQGIVDIIYNRPRPNDDKIPTKYGIDQGIPVYDMDYEGAGGNYMCDGQGIAVSTDLVWSENSGYTHQQIRDMVEDYLGIRTYHVIPDALGAYIKHIDCFAKFLAPDKVMIIEVPPSHSQYNELEDAVDYFEAQNSCYGTPYEVYRVYCPTGQSYINCLVLNDKLLMPISNSSWDDDAIESFEEAMPGYEVLGFTGSWASTDALHCRTMGIKDRFMLYVNHTPLTNQAPSPGGFLVEAEVHPYSGQSLINNTPVVYWKTTEGGSWSSVQMTYSGVGYIYNAYIPNQPHGTKVRYYIHAEDASGRSENHPYIGAPDAHTFNAMESNPSLDADTFALSCSGGVIDFDLDAGPSYGFRNYFLLGSISGTEPGLPLPGGQTLPLNWDVFTGFIFKLANTPALLDFYGTLDATGTATATLDTFGPLPGAMEGLIMNFAFTLYSPYGFVSNPIAVEVVE